jgi:hypothetical protein
MLPEAGDGFMVIMLAASPQLVEIATDLFKIAPATCKSGGGFFVFQGTHRTYRTYGSYTSYGFGMAFCEE